MPKQTKSSNNTALKGFALTLVILILAVCVMAAMTEGFSNWNPYGWFDEEPAVEQQSDGEETGEDAGGMVTQVQNSSLMTLSAVATTAAESSVESSTLLTATVAPGDANNQQVDWEVYFANPESEWASGKELSDYVTLTPTSDGALTATVNCLQAFGEQIIVKVISRDNPLATAICTIDYAQKVTSVTLKLGDITVNLGGTTNIRWQINANGEGFGGTPDLDYTVNDVYTLAEDFTVSINLVNRTFVSADDELTFGGLSWSCRGDFFGDITSSGIIFDRNLLVACDFIHFMRNGDIKLNDVTASELVEYTSSIENGRFAEVVVSISGTHNSFEYTSFLNISEFVNTATVTGVSLDQPSITF